MATKRTKTQPPEYHRHLIDRNFSERLGAPIQAVAIHSTESGDIKASWDDLHGVRNWFNNSASEASSHLGIDGDGHVEMWVPFEKKAWTILELNNRTVNFELVGRASQPRKDWEEAQIKAAARWAAYCCHKYDLPRQWGTVRNVHGYPVITSKGIITHKMLTDAGFGSHVDPGPSFPRDEFIKHVRYYYRYGWVPNQAEAH